jgi:iron-sulfur cluster assembly protein
MIILTEQAAYKVKEMLLENEDQGAYLRIGVDEGGCSGFSYSMGFDEKQESDIIVEQDGVKMIIAKDSERLLKGTTIDYKESMMGGGFSIDNPNASLTCGCGASFRTATDSGKPGEC